PEVRARPGASRAAAATRWRPAADLERARRRAAPRRRSGPRPGDFRRSIATDADDAGDEKSRAPSARQSVRAALALLRCRIVLARTVSRALRTPNRLQSIGNEAENNRRDRDDAEQHARADQVADEIRPGVHQVDDEHAAEETEDGPEAGAAEERSGNC